MPLQLSQLVTTDTFPGRDTREALGIVSAECVLGINIVNDLFSRVRDIFGGRSGTYQQALQEARATCLRELAANADQLGADAVLGVAMYCNGIGGGMLFLVATGTAVRLR